MQQPENRPVMLREIAKAAGVSRATVSRALNDNRLISEATRARIKAIAKKLGYRPDPEASRLLSYLKSTQKRRFQATLGILNAHSPPSRIHDDPYTHHLLAGAEQRAKDLGYAVDMLDLCDTGITPKRLGQIIAARSIRGVLVPPEPDPLFNMGLDWDPFAIVATTTTALPLHLHRVLPHNFHNMRLIFDAAIDAGYKRIGLIQWDTLEERQMHAASAIYALYGHVEKKFTPLPFLRWKWEAPDLTTDRVGAWVKKTRVDCVLGFGVFGLDALQRAGLRVPGDVGYISYSDAPGHVSRIDQMPALVGAAAIDLLSAQVQRCEHGLPAFPKTVMIEGRFIAAGTTRPPTR